MDKPFFQIISLSRPLFLIAGALFYALGAGIARYLGFMIDGSIYWIGQIAVLSLQITAHVLNEYFDWHGDRGNTNRTLFSGGSGVLGAGKGKLPEHYALLLAATSFTVFVLALIGLQRANLLSPTLLLILGLALLISVFYSVPPIRLAASGFGELAASFTLANLVPAFALVLQSGEMHRLLAMSTFPITALAMAAILTFEFPDYFNDMKSGKQTLLIRVDWKKGILLHAIFLMVAYGLMALSYAFGMPASIAIPPLLTFPVAALQIWLFTRIEDGAKPNWQASTIIAALNVMLVVYLFTFAYWTR